MSEFFNGTVENICLYALPDIEPKYCWVDRDTAIRGRHQQDVHSGLPERRLWIDGKSMLPNRSLVYSRDTEKVYTLIYKGPCSFVRVITRRRPRTPAHFNIYLENVDVVALQQYVTTDETYTVESNFSGVLHLVLNGKPSRPCKVRRLQLDDKFIKKFRLAPTTYIKFKYRTVAMTPSRCNSALPQVVHSQYAYPSEHVPAPCIPNPYPDLTPFPAAYHYPVTSTCTCTDPSKCTCKCACSHTSSASSKTLRLAPAPPPVPAPGPTHSSENAHTHVTKSTHTPAHYPYPSTYKVPSYSLTPGQAPGTPHIPVPAPTHYPAPAAAPEPVLVPNQTCNHHPSTYTTPSAVSRRTHNPTTTSLCTHTQARYSCTGNNRTSAHISAPVPTHLRTPAIFPVTASSYAPSHISVPAPSQNTATVPDSISTHARTCSIPPASVYDPTSNPTPTIYPSTCSRRESDPSIPASSPVTNPSPTHIPAHSCAHTMPPAHTPTPTPATAPTRCPNAYPSTYNYQEQTNSIPASAPVPNSTPTHIPAHTCARNVHPAHTPISIPTPAATHTPNVYPGTCSHQKPPSIPVPAPVPIPAPVPYTYPRSCSHQEPAPSIPVPAPVPIPAPAPYTYPRSCSHQELAPSIPVPAPVPIPAPTPYTYPSSCSHQEPAPSIPEPAPYTYPSSCSHQEPTPSIPVPAPAPIPVPAPAPIPASASHTYHSTCSHLASAPSISAPAPASFPDHAPNPSPIDAHTYEPVPYPYSSTCTCSNSSSVHGPKCNKLPDDKMEENEEVLARWDEDRRYYKGHIVYSEGSDWYRVRDLTNHRESISKENIIWISGRQVSDSEAYVLAPHPLYPWSYVPGCIVGRHLDTVTVRFYDDSVDRDIKRCEVYPAHSPEKHWKDVRAIQDREKDWEGKTAIIRNDCTGFYEIGTVGHQIGRDQKYQVELDSGTREQLSIHIYGKYSRRYPSTGGKYILACVDRHKMLYLPGQVKESSTNTLTVDFVDGKSLQHISKADSYWMNERHYLEARELFLRLQSLSHYLAVNENVTCT